MHQDIPLGTEVGLVPGNTVLDGDPVRPKRGTASNFLHMSIVAKRSPMSATAELLSLLELIRGFGSPVFGADRPTGLSDRTDYGVFP